MCVCWAAGMCFGGRENRAKFGKESYRWCGHCGARCVRMCVLGERTKLTNPETSYQNSYDYMASKIVAKLKVQSKENAEYMQGNEFKG